MKDSIIHVAGGGSDASSLQPNVCNTITIGYFADGIWAQNALKLFVSDSSIVVKFLVPRFHIPDDRLVQQATECDIAILNHCNINDPDFIEIIRNYKCDLFVSMSFDQIFGKQIINLPLCMTINCHAGKLPFYRGRNALNWALINDEKEFGITVHAVDENIDTGDILVQRTYTITDDDNYATLLRTAEIECASLLYETVKTIVNGTMQLIKQSTIHPLGFYCVKRVSGDEMIDWNTTSREVFNFIRAVCPPGPSARSSINGKEIKIHKAVYLPDAPKYKGVPGSVVQRESLNFCVKTIDSYVRIVSWEYEGSIRIGDRLKSNG